MSRRHLVALHALAVGAARPASCTTTLQGTPVSVFADPFSVAGMPAVDGPTGLRAGRRAARPATSTDTDGGEIDDLAGSAVSDIEEFWDDAYGETFDGEFTPVDEAGLLGLHGLRRRRSAATSTYGLVNAGYCLDDNTIGWDRGELLPHCAKPTATWPSRWCSPTNTATPSQQQAGLTNETRRHWSANNRPTASPASYMRWVAEGNSPRFTLSTGDGLNNLLAGDDLVPRPAAHRERRRRRRGRARLGVRADLGVPVRLHRRRRRPARRSTPRRSTSGAATCRCCCPTTRPANWPVTEDSVTVDRRRDEHPVRPARPAAAQLRRRSASNCPDARPSPPASYCPATNTIAVDLPALQKLGAPSEPGRRRLVLTGDNTAYSVAGVALHAGGAARSAAAWRSTTPRPACAPRA